MNQRITALEEKIEKKNNGTQEKAMGPYGKEKYCKSRESIEDWRQKKEENV